MSEKLNRGRWLNAERRDCCAICLKDGSSVAEARGCDGVHFHKYCGGKISATKNGLSCEGGCLEVTILNYIVKTREEALKDPRTKW